MWRHLKGQQGDWDEKAVSGSSPNQNGQGGLLMFAHLYSSPGSWPLGRNLGLILGLSGSDTMVEEVRRLEVTA